MSWSANPKLPRRRPHASNTSPPALTTPGPSALHELETNDRHVRRQAADDGLVRVISELSHDLRQPLTSLNMNLQTAVKMLQLPTPQVSGALEALVDCLSTDRDMVELIAHARRRAAVLSTHAPIPLNDVASDLLLTARSLEPQWRLRLSERLAAPSPLVTGGFVRLRLGLLSILRRSLILDESEPARADSIVIETRTIGDRAELRFTGLPASLPLSHSFQSLHMLITTLVGYLRGHAHLTLQDERVSFVISTPVAPMSTLHLPGGRHGV